MNLARLDDDQLMVSARAFVEKERAQLVPILHHIREMDRRRLQSKFRKPGLLELVMDELGYARDQALRRIQAMRMMSEVPEIESRLKNGAMDLTKVGIIQVLFSGEKRVGKPYSHDQKLEVIEEVSGKSSREAQRIVYGRSSTPHNLKERLNQVGIDVYEFVACIDSETVAAIEKIKGMLAHVHPNLSNGQLLKMLTELGEKEFERSKPVAAPRPNSRAEIRRQVWKSGQGKCKICGSVHAVQVDHIIAKALGGQYTLDNLRLLCRSCNQRHAMEDFGVDKMNHHMHPQ